MIVQMNLFVAIFLPILTGLVGAVIGVFLIHVPEDDLRRVPEDKK